MRAAMAAAVAAATKPTFGVTPQARRTQTKTTATATTNAAPSKTKGAADDGEAAGFGPGRVAVVLVQGVLVRVVGGCTGDWVVGRRVVGGGWCVGSVDGAIVGDLDANGGGGGAGRPACAGWWRGGAGEKERDIEREKGREQGRKNGREKGRERAGYRSAAAVSCGEAWVDGVCWHRDSMAATANLNEVDLGVQYKGGSTRVACSNVSRGAWHRVTGL